MGARPSMASIAIAYIELRLSETLSKFIVKVLIIAAIKTSRDVSRLERM